MSELSIQFVAYDTLCHANVLRWRGESGPEQLLRGVRDIALRVQGALNMYDDASELSVLCRTYRQGVPTKVSSMLFSFLEENLKVCRASGGAFDPTVAPLVKLWDFLADTPCVPAATDLQAALAKVGYGHIQLDKEDGTVTFDTPDITIDPGASGKGFALGIAAGWLRENGVESAVLNFGNNLYVIGSKDIDEEGHHVPWKTAIRNPDDLSGIIGTVPLHDGGISTSSWYEHCFSTGGKVYHHLLDPRTGRPAKLEVKSMSVVSSSGMFTDVLSTAFFLLGVERTAELAQALREETGETVEYVAVAENGKVTASSGAEFCAAVEGRLPPE